jgi:hypothetical protein
VDITKDMSGDHEAYLRHTTFHKGTIKVHVVPDEPMEKITVIHGDLILYVKGDDINVGHIFPNLRTVEGSVQFYFGGARGRSAHGPYVLPELRTVTGNLLFQNYKLGLGNAVPFLPLLEKAGSLTYAGGSFFVGGGITPFPRLSTISKNLTVSSLQDKTNISGLFPRLHHVGEHLQVFTMDASCLIHEPVFPLLRRIGKNLDVIDVTGHPNLPRAMPSLAEIGGSLCIRGGGFSGNLEFRKLIILGGCLSIARCPDVKIVKGLHRVTACRVDLEDLRSATNILALSMLQSCPGDFMIRDCPLLVGVSCVGSRAKNPITLRKFSLDGDLNWHAR